MNKNDLLVSLRSKRKKYGKDSKEVYKAIHKLILHFPLYEGHLESWLRNNELKLR